MIIFFSHCCSSCCFAFVANVVVIKRPVATNRFLQQHKCTKSLKRKTKCVNLEKHTQTMLLFLFLFILACTVSAMDRPAVESCTSYYIPMYKHFQSRSQKLLKKQQENDYDRIGMMAYDKSQGKILVSIFENVSVMDFSQVCQFFFNNSFSAWFLRLTMQHAKKQKCQWIGPKKVNPNSKWYKH